MFAGSLCNVGGSAGVYNRRFAGDRRAAKMGAD
jgi:hypothetical protein